MIRGGDWYVDYRGGRGDPGEMGGAWSEGAEQCGVGAGGLRARNVDPPTSAAERGGGGA